jgi:putative sigma-54 modulation protein
MQSPIQITFLGLDPPDGVDSLIRQQATVFERFADRMSSCHVVVDMPHGEQFAGNHYAVRIYITTVVGEIAATRDGSRRDLRAVIAEVFTAALGKLDAQLPEQPASGVRRKAPDAAASSTPALALPLTNGRRIG